MRSTLKNIFGRLFNKRDPNDVFVTPGHFYCPLPSIEDVLSRKDEIFVKRRVLPGVDMNEKAQLELLEELKKFYHEINFTEKQSPDFRYYLNNVYFSNSDAVFLYCMIRHFKPARYMEVGSGFSSALVLDLRDNIMPDSMSCTFIEPYPEERLLKLLSAKDARNPDIKVMQKFVQDVKPEEFAKLKANDILFIDSSHVAKIGSDVCYLFFEILPLLNKGVIVHFHDVFTSFEYPIEWIKEKRAWNEAYLLRAFLMYNDSFEILAFSAFLEDFHEEWFVKNMPLCLNLHEKRIEKRGVEYLLPTRGQSIWLRKTS